MNDKDQSFALSGCTVPGDAKLNAFTRDIWGAAWGAAVKVEREACAKVCQSLWDLRDDERARMYAAKCADAIRGKEQDMTDSIPIKSDVHIIESNCLPQSRFESLNPVGYRLVRDAAGELHLQGAFEWWNGGDGGIEWRVIPTVELT